MNNFSNLNWQRYYASTMTASKKGRFTNDGVRKELQKMSDGLKNEGKDASVGCSMHFKRQGVWGSAIMTKAGIKVKIFSEDMYPKGSEKYELFVNDDIDEIQFFVENNSHENNKDFHHLKPKKDEKSKYENKKEIGKSIFNVKK